MVDDRGTAGLDAYSRAIVGWTAASTKTTALVSKALDMAVWRRDHNGRPVEPGLIHHSDAGRQYTSVKFTEFHALQGLTASIGSAGDAHDNTLAESIIGLFRTAVINRHRPFKTLAEVEYALTESADRYNSARPHARLAYRTPAEHKSTYYAPTPTTPTGTGLTPKPVPSP